MKKLVFLLTIMMVALFNQSCKPNLEIDGTVYGIVTDAHTGEPIVGCKVYLAVSSLNVALSVFSQVDAMIHKMSRLLNP